MTWIPDASSISAFRENPERFRLRYRKHLVPAKREEAPNSGTAAHAAFDYWFMQPTSDLEGALAALRTAWGEEPLFHEGLERPLSLFEQIMTVYAEVYPREKDPFKVLAGEEHFQVRIERADVSFDWCGIKDKRLDFDGELALLDHKTTSAWFHTAKTEGYFAQYEIGEQMLGYVASEIAEGRECRVFYIDAVHVDTQYKKVKAERDFRRWRSPGIVQDWRLDRWARDIDYTLQQIRYLDETRGPDVPWPVYTNMKFNKPDDHWDFYTSAPEMHKSVALGFEERAWEPWTAATNGGGN